MTLLTEIANIKQLLNKDNQESRMIVFYAESSIYYLYFEGFIKYILDNSEHIICYITSDPDDPVFKLQSERFKVLNISNTMLSYVTPMLDSKVFMMTMTDLGRYHIKRSSKNVNHIYVFHAILSTHMVYTKGSFDNYDTIFCIGPYHVDEIRQTERHYGLKKKQLVEVGYPLLEKIHHDHEEFKKTHIPDPAQSTLVLIAPSWHTGNIVESCIDDLVLGLIKSGYKVVLRPHPETMKRNKGKIKAVVEKYEGESSFELDRSPASLKYFHAADVLITDWSGIAFEYAFGTERPVLFINTPPKVHNNEFEKINIEPVELKLRNEIGISMNTHNISAASSETEKLLLNGDQFRDAIITCRSQYIYNWMSSAAAGGKYILNFVNKAV